MTIYQAISSMRELTKAGKTFSFSFMSYSRSRQQTEGIIEVRTARLRNRGKKENNIQAEIMEEYMDLDQNQPRHFYHPALMTFNGQKVTLQ